MTIYCTVCRDDKPATATSCGSCGSPRTACEGQRPPRKSLRCVKCGGGAFRRINDGRQECQSCHWLAHSVAFIAPVPVCR